MTALLQIALALPFGVGVGLVHFRALRAGSAAFVGGSAGRALGLTVLRFGLTLGFFVLAALAGAPALLAGAVGFTIGRAVELHRVRARP